MAKRKTDTKNFHKSLEFWATKSGPVIKVAVRDEKGRFHGSTNFPGADHKLTAK